MADVTFMAGTIGMTLPFVVTDFAGGILQSAACATVTWLAADGRQRPLTLLVEASAVFGYTLSMGDYPGPRYERGELLVSLGSLTTRLSSFTVHVTPHL